MNQDKGQLTAEEALALARELCRSRDWPWLEPVDVKAKGDYWVILTNAQSRGANVSLRIRRADGETVEAVFLPR